MSSNNLADNHQPINHHRKHPSDDSAINLIRSKISALYSEEPDAKKEIIESESAGRHRSKHQEFMHELSSSGKSLAEIQTAWHNYYIGLPDEEKHQVWQEFYSEYNKSGDSAPGRQAPKIESHVTSRASRERHQHTDERSILDIRKSISGTAHRKRVTKKMHLHSMLFGLSVGLITVLFLVFGFFNERFIAPFINPSKEISNTPIVIDPVSSAVGQEPKIIIPKINVEIPVVYDQPSINEKDIQASLEEGVVHYATTPNPGEKGNGVIFGHSSNNILNKGKYKFAFVLLKKLEPGDTFYLQKDGKRYVYKVADKTVVKPSDVSVLYRKTDKSTMTLVTCDPPGTSLNRLLVVGEQISPDPAKNIASTAKQSAEQPTVIPSNAPSLWQKIKDWISS